MMLKTFTAKDGKQISLRTIEKDDIKRVKEFTNYINEIIDEDDYITIDKKYSPKDERKWINNALKGEREKEAITIVAEFDGAAIGFADIHSRKWRENHIATLAITIKIGYREIGIGTQLILTIIDEAKKRLKAKTSIIELEVCETNEHAKNVYQKLGFKKVAELPDRIQRRGKLISKYLMYNYL